MAFDKAYWKRTYAEYYEGARIEGTSLIDGVLLSGERWALCVNNYLRPDVSEQAFMTTMMRPFGWKYGVPKGLVNQLVQLEINYRVVETLDKRPADLLQWARDRGYITDHLQ